MFGRVGENKNEALHKVASWDDQQMGRVLSIEGADERKMATEDFKQKASFGGGV